MPVGPPEPVVAEQGEVDQINGAIIVDVGVAPVGNVIDRQGQLPFAELVNGGDGVKIIGVVLYIGINKT